MNLHDRDIQREARKDVAIESAVIAIQKYKIKPETAAKDFNAPLEKVLEQLESACAE
jgi:hypothetical protein